MEENNQIEVDFGEHNHNKQNNNNLFKKLVFTPSTSPSVSPSPSRSLSPILSYSKNFTEFDADLNIFSDQIDSNNNNNNPNIVDKLLQTITTMKQEISKLFNIIYHPLYIVIQHQ